MTSKYCIPDVQVVFGCDHAGFSLKTSLIEYAQVELNRKVMIKDIGAYNDVQSVPYPQYAESVAHQLHREYEEANMCVSVESDCRMFGVLVCGTGIGMSIAANRYSYIRAALCHNIASSYLARQHNNANVLVLGQKFTSKLDAIAIFKMFLTTPFSYQDRHLHRLRKLKK